MPQAMETGLEHHRAGRLQEAEQAYRQVLEAEPDNPAALHLLGVLAHQAGNDEASVELIDRALAIKPGFAEALSNRANALQRLKRYGEALASCDRALELKPDFADALYNRGHALRRLARFEEAVASYDSALARVPAYPGAWYHRGNSLLYLRRYGEAVASYDKALATRADHADALHNRGICLQELGLMEEAVASWRKALAIDPGYVEARSACLHGRQHLCDWPGLESEVEALRALVMEGGSGKVVPFHFLVFPGTRPREHLACARQFAERRYGELFSHPPLHEVERAQGRKLRIGYLSADFNQHPVSNLVVEVIELHDRERFDVFGYSYAADDATPMRRRLEAAFDSFVDIAPMADAQAARRISADRIDILVDLTGYTRNARLQVIALRPAPVQVSWLGYPGTLGHGRLADYMIGDPIVSPLAHAGQFSESLALMPLCVQPNDRQRATGARPAREAAGLPREGFVFCCFNQTYKITPGVFAIWCRLLAAVPGSVLWLVSDIAATQRNLRAEARGRGIDAERIVFAPRLPYAEHLGRFQLADLFLDTFPITAGATGSDALWAGVPLVTCLGETYFGRYAASLLHAAGLPELVARSIGDYEALARELALDPARLEQKRARLAANRSSCALFDSVRFTRDLERLLQRMRG